MFLDGANFNAQVFYLIFNCVHTENALFCLYRLVCAALETMALTSHTLTCTSKNDILFSCRLTNMNCWALLKNLILILRTFCIPHGGGGPGMGPIGAKV